MSAVFFQLWPQWKESFKHFFFFVDAVSDLHQVFNGVIFSEMHFKLCKMCIDRLFFCIYFLETS